MRREDFPLASLQPLPAAGVAIDRVEVWLRDFLQREFAIGADRWVPSADLYRDLDLDSIDTVRNHYEVQRGVRSRGRCA